MNSCFLSGPRRRDSRSPYRAPRRSRTRSRSRSPKRIRLGHHSIKASSRSRSPLKRPRSRDSSWSPRRRPGTPQPAPSTEHFDTKARSPPRSQPPQRVADVAPPIDQPVIKVEEKSSSLPPMDVEKPAQATQESPTIKRSDSPMPLVPEKPVEAHMLKREPPTQPRAQLEPEAMEVEDVKMDVDPLQPPALAPATAIPTSPSGGPRVHPPDGPVNNRSIPSGPQGGRPARSPPRGPRDRGHNSHSHARGGPPTATANHHPHPHTVPRGPRRGGFQPQPPPGRPHLTNPDGSTFQWPFYKKPDALQEMDAAVRSVYEFRISFD